MDKLASYRNILKELLIDFAESMSQSPQADIDTELTFDEIRDHYMLLRLGWSAQGRVFVPTLYARLNDGKIWIENDWTDEGLATRLLAKGVPARDIVLAFHPPDIRPHTEFAVA